MNLKLKTIRDIMKTNNIDAYFITTSDYHQSEYIGDFFKVREYISGFKGSFGDLIITENKAVIFTDGRYKIQVQEQLLDTGIDFFINNEKETPSMKEWIKENLNSGDILGFNGKITSANQGKEFKEYLETFNIGIDSSFDKVDEFWQNRPALSGEKAFILNDIYTGETLESKFSRVRKEMEAKNVDKLLISTLDDIAWLLNLRGQDIKYMPVVLGYLILDKKEGQFYVDFNKISPEIKEKLLKNNIELKEYNEIYSDLDKVSEQNIKVWMDSSRTNFNLHRLLKESNILNAPLPTELMKALKNEIELENSRWAHIKDGVAVTKFLYWVKTHDKNGLLTEISGKNKINSLRGEQDNFIEPSFNTISGYMSNAAMPHYSVTNESSLEIGNKGLYLVDSGGQYLEGTTDITRTIVVGELTKEMKRNFTLVLKGMLNISNLKFIEGTRGSDIDLIARQFLFQYGLNYNHGTGHGIGHVLGVHEGPHRINNISNVKFENGMVVTNEPGLYLKDNYGIRIENELIIRKYMETEYGLFYQFETLTYVPIDLDAVEVEMLTPVEKEFLNSYHKKVYTKLSPYLTEQEQQWLLHETRTI